MRPRDDYERNILTLSQSLKPIHSKVKQWAYKKQFPKILLKTKHKSTCFECGHSWQQEDSELIKNTTKCPSCNNKLVLSETKGYKHVYDEYFTVFDVIDGIQVIRYFYITQHLYKGYKAEYICNEVCQHWIDENGRITIMGVNINSFSYSKSWVLHSPLSIKNSDFYYPHNCPIYKNPVILPIILRNGFKEYDFTFNVGWHIHLLLIDNVYETIIKTNHFEFLERYHRFRDDIITYWKSFKVCIRNNYHPDDVSLWFDYLYYLEYFNKDLLSPKYICPKNLKKEHDKYLRKKKIIERKEKYQEQLLKIEQDNAEYIKSKKNFLDFKISDNELEIVVLNSVREFFIEGEELNHCVFENEYYKKDSLVLSARVNNNRLETIELTLNPIEIIQCRGRKNQNTEYHDRILKLLKKNFKHIKKLIV